eukprot:TRINITY_DN3694_c0_g1_i1.p1 TRINITY_DN3694_c0_g1~~TRINITY_DN3694_c0_g1_i1.p1  ORF type:complete len:229 (-),score=55.77 TRINITY_DN3694_c0_g1_i1:234-920(-)
MSSLRNAVKRKTHKERAQPSERRRFGLLEKHKDYVLRARDYHRKEDAIQLLKEKAAFRNPDEFYFKMQNTRTKDGVHIGRSNEANKYTPDQLLLMKTQDVRYVVSKAQSEAKKVERLQAALHLVGADRQNKHMVFTEDGKRKRKGDDESLKETEASPLPPGVERKRTAAYRELEQRKERAKTLASVAQEMAFKKTLMGKGRVRKLKLEEGEEGSVQRPVYKWKNERKR